MYDRRYPMMFPLDGREIPRLPSHMRANVLKAGNEIARRTGARAFYNAAQGSILFVYGDEPHGGPMALPITDILISQSDIDSAVEYIGMGKMARREKDRIAEKNRVADEHRHAKRTEKHLAERRPDAMSYARFLDEKRRGVQKLSVAL